MVDRVHVFSKHVFVGVIVKVLQAEGINFCQLPAKMKIFNGE